MSDPWLGKVKTRWNATGVGTNAGVSVTKAAVAGTIHNVTHISYSGDGAALVTIESPANTILWKKRFAGAFSGSESFAPGVFVSGSNTAILVKISASTANSEANIAGLSITG